MTIEVLRRATKFLAPLAAIYGYRLRDCGPSARGVFWRSEDGQRLRFDVLLRAIDPDDLIRGGITINDLGCGYGAFFDHLADRPVMTGSRYVGYDICEDMVEVASERIRDPRATFQQAMVARSKADYSFASGTFNMKLDETDRDWAAYVEASLAHLWQRTGKALAFNMLCARTKKRKESDLYYADWKEYEDFCRSELSPRVSVLRDYPLDEFTIVVHR